MFNITRYPYNPVLKPDIRYSWQALATFNGCPIRTEDITHIFFRALSLPQYTTIAQKRVSLSTIGHAVSTDGFHFTHKKQSIVPEYEWERFGCEDPRVTFLDGMYYIFYTALSTYPFNAGGIKVAVALSEDLTCIKEKHLVTPFNGKAMALFPKRIRGKMAAVLSVNTDQPPSKTGIIYFDEPSQLWDAEHWNAWYRNIDAHTLTLKREDDDHIEVGAPPIEVDEGWLLIYSHINHYGKKDVLFGIEAALLDKQNPSVVLCKTHTPLITPEEYNELHGMVPNVIFPSGALKEKNTIHIFYGAADTTCNVASIPLTELSRHMGEPTQRHTTKLIRCHKEPIITPKKANEWESRATFNPAAFYADNKVHIVYRAMSAESTSVFGYAVSKDGITVDERLETPIYVPRAEFESKKGTGNSGCEDPRITVLDDTVYMLYTAFDGRHPPRVRNHLPFITEFFEAKIGVGQSRNLSARPGWMIRMPVCFLKKSEVNILYFTG